MNTAARRTTRMATDLLTLAQWLSPTYPVGAFAYSHGIETAIREGGIGSAAALETWLRDLLLVGSGRADAVLLGAAYRAESGESLWEIDALARAFAASSERVREGERQGAAFAATTRAVWQIVLPDLMYPVAVGRAACLMGIPAEPTAALYLQAFASNLVSAAVRAVPMGQTEGQSVVAALSPVCLTTASEAIHAEPDDLWSNAWGSDIASMRHETIQPRLFQS